MACFSSIVCVPSSQIWISCGNTDFNVHSIHVELMRGPSRPGVLLAPTVTWKLEPVICNCGLFPHWFMARDPATRPDVPSGDAESPPLSWTKKRFGSHLLSVARCVHVDKPSTAPLNCFTFLTQTGGGGIMNVLIDGLSVVTVSQIIPSAGGSMWCPGSLQWLIDFPAWKR